MQQYVVAADKRAEAAEQKAIIANQKAAEADKRADNAEQETSKAKLQNITNIIKFSRKLNYTDKQIINQLIEDATLSRDEATKVLVEYKQLGTLPL